MTEIKKLIEKVSKKNPAFNKRELHNGIINMINHKRFYTDEDLNDALDEVLDGFLNYSPKKTKTRR